MKKISRKTRKMLVMVASLALVLGLAIGGTIAWLTDVTGPVTNTFTPSDIGITLTETPNNGDKWEAQVIPGKTYAKDPKVEVTRPKTNVDIYLFVKLESTADAYIDYTLNMNETNSGWTLVPNTTNVWYREVLATEQDPSWELIKGNTVTVKNLTKDQTSAVADAKLTFTAYAIQKEGFTPETAWAEVSKLG